MTDLTAEQVLEWIDAQTDTELSGIAYRMIERGLCASLDDVSDIYDFPDEEPDVDPALLEEVKSRLRRRDYREALHVLVKALGRDFDALEDIPDLAGAA